MEGLFRFCQNICVEWEDSDRIRSAGIVRIEGKIDLGMLGRQAEGAGGIHTGEGKAPGRP